ncbi:MAG: hypothetical protein JKX97_09350 [Candidatus Lindowbacteria bacterium]|nr:hypothetical protein [Candidatus Lindowbacteria bacterium]
MEHPEYEQRYADYAEHLLKFAKQHNLLLEKYDKDACTWSFLFKHPNGGHGNIGLRIHDTGRVYIGSSYVIDRYDEFRRYIKFGGDDTHDLARSAANIIRALESQLRIMLGWQLTDLQPGKNDHRLSWSMFAKAEFEALNDYLPEVIP